MYDYQNHFSDPDSFDRFLAEWRQVTGDKEFLSTKPCVDNSRYQVSSYRLALVMGELYHTNLTVADASAILYCWLLCNVERPSYGWTRTLFVADPVRGFVPFPSTIPVTARPGTRPTTAEFRQQKREKGSAS
jgi:hypothetical protein